MKFKDMTDEDIQYFAEVYKNKKLSWDERMQVLMEFTGKSERTVRKWASQKLKLSEKDDVVSPEYEKAKTRTFNKKKKRFIITWAQNNTPVHLKFFNNLIEYSKYIKADIHVMAGRYKNPTSIWTMGQQEEEKWSPVIIPYLDAGRHDIHRYLSIMSDVKIHPTAHNPMSGMEAMSGINSCIFGHPKLQMQTIPVLEDSKPKMMLTTGACTIRNYTDSKAGKKGEFHHVIGFAVVEIDDDKTFHVRQVSAEDNGDFCDLYNEVKFNGKETVIEFDDPLDKASYLEANFIDEPITIDGETTINNIDNIEACVLGDLHWGHHDPEVISTTTKMLERIKPNHVILHDVFDGYSINHHTMKNPFIQYGKEVRDENNLQKEIDEMLEGLDNFSSHKNVVIVRSNHDDFIDRWLISGDWKKQPTPKNSPLYMEYSAILLKQHGDSSDNVKGVIPEIINRKYPEFITLGRGDSYKVAGWELGQHGDMGSNGSRGSLLQFRRLNTKIVVGHYHSPGRKDGALAVGTSTKMRVGYNMGPSSWLQSHVIIHKNGKAQHINFINGKYTTFK
tara:strand:+ start:177 stop:1856 length:1680 start_codon:yes stop_codon:yes gene_type:complete